MRLSTSELLFVAFGAVLGGSVGLGLKAGILPASTSFPPFVLLLFGLALAEIVAGLATGRPPGQLVGMLPRVLAFALGAGVLMLTGATLV